MFIHFVKIALNQVFLSLLKTNRVYHRGLPLYTACFDVWISTHTKENINLNKDKLFTPE